MWLALSHQKHCLCWTIGLNSIDTLLLWRDATACCLLFLSGESMSKMMQAHRGAAWRNLHSRQEILASSRALLILVQKFFGKWFGSGCMLKWLHMEVISALGHESWTIAHSKLCEIAVINMRAQLEVPCRNANALVLMWTQWCFDEHRPQPLAPLSKRVINAQ